MSGEERKDMAWDNIPEESITLDDETFVPLPGYEPLADRIERAIRERDDAWGDILTKVSRLHMDSMELAKKIARDKALEEAAVALENLEIAGPYMGEVIAEAAKAVRALKGGR